MTITISHSHFAHHIFVNSGFPNFCDRMVFVRMSFPGTRW